jgi:hypothetical protein
MNKHSVFVPPKMPPRNLLDERSFRELNSHPELEFFSTKARFAFLFAQSDLDPPAITILGGMMR